MGGFEPGREPVLAPGPIPGFVPELDAGLIPVFVPESVPWPVSAEGGAGIGATGVLVGN